MDAEERHHVVETHVGALMQDLAPGSVPLGFVLLIECLDEEGDRVLWPLAHKDQRSWQTLGLLGWATQLEQAQIVIREEQETDDG